MPSKSLKPAMKQSTLSFGASKATAAANKVKKEVSESSSSTSKRPTRTAASKPSVVDIDSDKEIDVDDIEVAKSIPSSDSEIEQDDSEKSFKEKRESGKSAVVKRETRASKVKAKVEEAVAPAKVLGVPAEPKTVKKESAGEKKDVEEEAALRPNLNIKNRAYDKISHETRAKRGFAQTIHPTTEVDGKEVPLNRVDEILHLFDMSYEYGPCVGMTRLERWERANKLGMSPPSEIYDILMTKEGLKETRYSQNVLYGRV